MRRPFASEPNSISNSARFSASIRPLTVKITSPFADLVISAGGTMNREAVALGVPVYTTFEGRPGAVDERLIGEGRMRRLSAAKDLRLAKRDHARLHARARRDPRVLVELLTRPLHAGDQGA